MNYPAFQKLCYPVNNIFSSLHLMKFFSIFRFNLIIVSFLILLPAFSIRAQTSGDLIYYNEAVESLKKQDFASAGLSFQQALKISPEDDKARRGLAIALIGLEKFPEASREIAKLLVKFPKDSELLEMAAQCFWLQKRFAEAEKVLSRLLSTGNGKTENWVLYGDVLDAQKKTREAAGAYENALKLAPDSIDVRYALGALNWKLFRYDDAEKIFLEVLRRVPNEPRASFNLGDIYLTKGDSAKAIPFLEISVKAFPDEFDTHFALGRALLAQNKFIEAISEFNAAIKANSEIAEGYYQLGLALQRSGQSGQAKIAFKKAQELQNAKRAAEGAANPMN